MSELLTDTLLTPERLKALPKAPGVYLMKDTNGKVIYVGKAKNLRARVRSYFTGRGDGRYSIRFLVQKVKVIDTVVTLDEREALVLENDFIKKHKPRYNVRLKDDKAHFVVRIDLNSEWPRIDLVREIRDDGARYIGPYAFSYELRSLLDIVKQSVPLRTCSDRVMHNRVRPCLEYQIKRCAGPCCLPVDPEQYRAWVRQAMGILDGKDQEVAAQLQRDMEQASSDLRFEDAALLRDRIAVLSKLRTERAASDYGAQSSDVFGLYREGPRAELMVLVVRQGRIFGAKSFGLDGAEIPDAELMGSLMSQYYDGNQDVPEEIILPFRLEDQAARAALYGEKRSGRVRFRVPLKGKRFQLLRLAERNARENLLGRPGAASRNDAALEALRAELNLDEIPRVIECVDISHFQGGETVGSVVSFEDGEPNKSRYRAFKLSQEGKPDDFASMRETLKRHLTHQIEEGTLPDLLVIDGGPAQLSQGLLIRRELGISRPPMVGLAKKRTIAKRMTEEVRYKPERIFVERESIPVVLKPTSEALHLLERVRDEAHRFAITFHRRSRKRRTFRSELDNVPGIGPNRKRELLRAFGSASAIREATVEEIVRRCKIPESLAVRILDILHRSKDSG